MKNNTAVIIVDMQDFFLKNFKSDIRNKLIANQIKVIDFYLKNKTPFVLLEYRCRGIFRGKVIKEIDQRVVVIVLVAACIIKCGRWSRLTVRSAECKKWLVVPEKIQGRG